MVIEEQRNHAITRIPDCSDSGTQTTEMKREVFCEENSLQLSQLQCKQQYSVWRHGFLAGSQHLFRSLDLRQIATALSFNFPKKAVGVTQFWNSVFPKCTCATYQTNLSYVCRCVKRVETFTNRDDFEISGLLVIISVMPAQTIQSII